MPKKVDGESGEKVSIPTITKKKLAEPEVLDIKEAMACSTANLTSSSVTRDCCCCCCCGGGGGGGGVVEVTFKSEGNGDDCCWNESSVIGRVIGAVSSAV